MGFVQQTTGLHDWGYSDTDCRDCADICIGDSSDFLLHRTPCHRNTCLHRKTAAVFDQRKPSPGGHPQRTEFCQLAGKTGTDCNYSGGRSGKSFGLCNLCSIICGIRGDHHRTGNHFCHLLIGRKRAVGASKPSLSPALSAGKMVSEAHIRTVCPQ